MPCYDPPPHYAGREAENLREAARILCELVGGRIKRGEPLSMRLLAWYAEHRLVDLDRAKDLNHLDEALAIQAELPEIQNRIRLASS